MRNITWLKNLYSFFDRETPQEKNLLALGILLTGLFIGSLFVDVIQLVTGSGFSKRVVRDHNLLVSEDKTWVAYREPRVLLTVINDANCADCTYDEALVWLRRIVPTIDPMIVDIQSEEGRMLREKLGLRTLPAFYFGRTVIETDFFKETEPLFREIAGGFVFDMNKIGLPVGKYLTGPSRGPQDIVLGNPDAALTVVVYTDFECEYCKTYAPEYRRLLETFDDKLSIVIKHLPLPAHPQAVFAAEAAQCAFAQGKFQAYSDLLFARQEEWGRAVGNERFKIYANEIRGLDQREFRTCVDSGRYSELVSLQIEEAQDFNIDTVPSTFIGTEYLSGSANYDDLRSIVEEVLNKNES